uniref:Katanin p80 WD40 repeat-containing subunit B1 homolog isoform X2 n=1 Tax=Rhizophora mucronata TaxID=61149 RepID=A0A2P2L2Q2_RHIMU
MDLSFLEWRGVLNSPAGPSKQNYNTLMQKYS